MTNSQKIKVAFLASEADPLVKVGGLGDVAGSLPHALNQLPLEYSDHRGLDVRLFIPFHAQIKAKINPQKADEFSIQSSSGKLTAHVFEYLVNGVTTYLFAGSPFGENEPVYTANNVIDGDKYTFFTLAAIQFLKRLPWKPDIFHANDWHTAIGVYLISKDRKKSPSFFAHTRTILTVHNLPYMGSGAETALEHFQIPPAENPNLPDWANQQPLPLGLQSADQIVTVSPGYAREILTPEFGCTLETYLKSRAQSISGIVNGLDVQVWNPEKDPAIFQTYSHLNLEERKANKIALLKSMDLPLNPETPLMVFISRMDQQKGIDIVLDALSRLLKHPWNTILLGTGNQELMQACLTFQKAHPSRVRVELRFDANLAHQMYAGADMLMMPSRYEPCGLAQMIAMRYGCIPIARATGGLKDTIIDHSKYPLESTGFLFEPATGPALASSLKSAIALYQQPIRWQAIQHRGMQKDFSWQNSAIDYAKTYLNLMEKPL